MELINPRPPVRLSAGIKADQIGELSGGESFSWADACPATKQTPATIAPTRAAASVFSLRPSINQSRL
jgi:hypothetical protein